MKRIGSLRVWPLCLGGNVFGWTADGDATEQILDAFTEAGGNFIDTADAYSSWVPGHAGGESESLIGAWLRSRGNRNRLVLATKVGKSPRHRGLRPANLRVCLDGSRRRLGVETVDLYYAHEDDPTIPTEDWIGAFDQMIRDGSIRHYGLSNFTPQRVAEVIGVAKDAGLATPVAVQNHYNLLNRAETESGLAEAAAEAGLAMVPYFGLAAGFLTGKYRHPDDIHGARAARVKQWATPEGFAVVEELVAVAEELGFEPATVALAWLAQRPGVTAPIASVSSPDQLPAMLAAAELKLPRTLITRLEKVSAPFA